MAGRRGFTLVELMIVITIILAVSVIALPGVVSAIAARQVDASVQILQGAIVGARDRAVMASAPAGLRLLPNPADANSLVTILPMESAPDYTDGLINTFPAEVYAASVTGGLPCLVLEESPGHWEQVNGTWAFLPNTPTAWAWNVRAGDKVRIGNGHVFTVCGPLPQTNQDFFVSGNTLQRTYTAPDGTTTVTVNPEFLLLTNGLDDDKDGFADNGWDGIDNNLNGTVDDAAEWETETWGARPQANAAYTIVRRPVPSKGQTISLGAGIDLGQSTLPVSPLDGSVEFQVAPNGSVRLASMYGTPASVGLKQAKLVFWLGTQSDHRVVTLWTRTGLIEAQD
jgi:prepilin-type N-terminal cleavage/methylation domain-containing protein